MQERAPDPPGEMPDSITLRPVGIIRNKVREPFLSAGDGDIEMRGGIDAVRADIRESHQDISEIIINKGIMDILDGIEEYSHLVVLYWAHRVPDQSRLLTRVHPMGRKDYPLAGIFATCSPVRPNPVLMTVVQLRGRRENVLQVSGLDAVDGSPIIDIKPYIKESYSQSEVIVPEWMERLCQELSD